ncbi:MAG: acyl-CoA thioesterase [Acidimicrobiales bacterium]
MLSVFDVVDEGAHRFVGTSDGGDRRVVDGSQLLGQAIVAGSKALPRHAVRSAHAVFARAVDDERPVWFAVDVTHEGRTVAAAVVTVGQAERRCASVSLLLDVEQEDVIRHGAAAPDVGRPDDATSFDMPMAGRRLALVGVVDPNRPDEVGPPVLDAWVHYEPVPSRTDLARALLSHFTGHLSISATMRAHPGFGTSMAHRTVSTAVMSITVTFHEPVAWDGWLLYHHESVHVGGGMSYVRGQVFTEQGRLVASFGQEGMIRAFAGDPSVGSLPVDARL